MKLLVPLAVGMFLGSQVHAVDRFDTIRQSLGPDEELVMIEIPPTETFPLRNSKDPSHEKTALGQCFGIVHLDQKIAALHRADQLLIEGPRDEAAVIQAKLMKASKGEAFEPISGFSNLSQFYQDTEVQSVLETVVKEVQISHAILSDGKNLEATLDKISAQQAQSPFSFQTGQSGAGVAAAVTSSIDKGRSLHLLIRGDESQSVGHSVQVVGYIRNKTTKEIKKIVVQDSNYPEVYQVLDQSNGIWSYPMTADGKPQAVVLSTVSDGTEKLAGRSLMAEIPRAAHAEKSAIVLANPRPYQFHCTDESRTPFAEFFTFRPL